MYTIINMKNINIITENKINHKLQFFQALESESELDSEPVPELLDGLRPGLGLGLGL